MYAKDETGKPIVGTLMRVEEDLNSRYRFEVWFDYTRDVMNTISEGAMIAVPNFFLDRERRKQEWSSVLEITSLLPVHYAIGQTNSGFPGFLVEAARSAAQDWVDQESQATDDTTKIRCVAIPTNLMIDEEGAERPEEGMPMVGHRATLLDTAMTQRLANLGIDSQVDDVAPVGPLIRDNDVVVLLRVEEALRTHFGVFGFTGAGKSNLLSTLVATFLGTRHNRPPVKLVVFDLMGEFSVLLMDLLVDQPRSCLLAVGAESLPDSVLRYLGQSGKDLRLLEEAARDLGKTSLYPKKLKEREDQFLPAFRALLEKKKLRIWQERRTIGRYVADKRADVTRGNMGNSRDAVMDLLNRLEDAYADSPFSSATIAQAQCDIDAVNHNLNATATANLRNLRRWFDEELAALDNRPQAPAAALVSVPKLVSRLNAADESSLIVIQAADPDQLRQFAYNLGMGLYEDRRRTGQISPLVSFVFDEADEFIPQTYDSASTYASSSQLAVTLARRGRKFGLGIGIATQRVTHLNTSIMAQPHTYFISKLPRRSDRERVCEAFGISEDMFRQTFKFRKGNWLLVSHDATGLESVPLPIRTQNADERITSWLERMKEPVKGARH